MIVTGWELCRHGEPLVLSQWTIDALDSNAVAVEVAACAVCHTDAACASDSGDAARALGHEIAGTVVAAGSEAQDWLGHQVVVPPVAPCEAVTPCSGLHMCRHCEGSGDGVHGGFASHVVVPARGLCDVNADELAASGVALPDLAALAEAVAVPYHAIARSGLRGGELAIFVGVGGTGGFGAQIAAALDARVVALDVVDDRLDRAERLGAHYGLNVAGRSPDSVRRAIEAFARLDGARKGWKVYETSGTRAGQELAVRLLGHEGCLAVIGTDCTDVTLLLNDLPRLDAMALGTSMSVAADLPAALDLILAGDVIIDPLVDRRPMSAVNDTLEEVRVRGNSRRPLLIPDFANGTTRR